MRQLGQILLSAFIFIDMSNRLERKEKKAMKLLSECLRMQVPQESKERSVMHN